MAISARDATESPDTGDSSRSQQALRAQRLAQLTPEKRALLERALLAKRGANGDPGRIPKRDLSIPTLLSFPQQRLWFFDQLEPQNITYNACVAMELRGALHLDALQAAIDCVVARHEVIRTVYPSVEGKPEQRILESWSLPIELVDLSQYDDTDLDVRVQTAIDELPRLPYNLQADLTMRIALIRRTITDHVLLIMEHHIAFDGWSDEILCSEIKTAYEAHLAGVEPKLPELAIQYGDFAAWQHARLTEDRLNELQTFWKQYLAGSPALIALPTDLARPERQTFNGARVYINIDAEILKPLAALGRAEGATPFMVLLAGFDALLHRWSGATDIVIGTPIANRNRVELEGLIGFFSNTLAVRSRLEASMTMRELVRHVREQALAAFENQELPFDRIVEAAQPVRNPAYNPLFQVNFRVTGGGDALLDLPGVVATPLNVDVGFARFDLAMELQQTANGLAGYLEYNVALFEPGTGRSLVSAFAALLKEALERPDDPISQLKMAETKASGGIRSRRR